jgi:serine/threonine-protein kinase HipA
LLLARFGGEWYEALNGAPSTHILKPAGVWEHSAENEALVMTLARALGLTDRAVWVERVAGRPVFVAERYDRVVRGRKVLRLHQEDMCQALGIRAAQKYEIGRPSARMAGVLRVFTESPQSELERLFRHVVFRVLIGDEDSHGKNHSLLLADGRVTLAPMYDSLCTLLYPLLSGMMAAPIGRFESLLRVTPDALVDEAREMGIPRDRAAEVLGELAESLDLALDGIGADLTSGWPAEQVVDIVRGRIRRLRDGKSLGEGPAKPARRRVSLDEASARRSRDLR